MSPSPIAHGRPIPGAKYPDDLPSETLARLAAHAEQQRFLNSPFVEVHLTVREFYGWLFMAFTYGAVAAVVAMIAAGKL